MRRAVAVLSVAAALLARERAVVAGPLDDPHVGGVGFSGPTSGDLAAVYWNPAALGLMEGGEVSLVLSRDSATSTVTRTPIDPKNGVPGGTRAFPVTRGEGVAHPATWPPGPGSFAAVGATIGRRFTIAVAAFTPFVQVSRYGEPLDTEQPARYHLVRADLRNIALTPALAFRVGKHLHLGAAPGFLFSTGRFSFDHDTALAAGSSALAGECGGTPCGAENAAAAARYDIESPSGPFGSSLAFTVGAGLHYERDRLSLGLAYYSRPLGADGGGVSIDGSRSAVTLPARAAPSGPRSLCPPGGPDNCVYARLGYGLPDIVTAGVGWRFGSRTEDTGTLRWLNYSEHERISIRVTGPASSGLRFAGLPESFVTYRGFRDAVDARLRIAYRPNPAVRVGAGLRGETSAVPRSHVNPAAVDGLKVEPAVMAEVRVRAWLRLAAGYALAFMPEISTGASSFSPEAATACVDAGGDLTQASCRARLAGRAGPTAAGSYRLFRHTGSLAVTALF